MPRRFLLFLLLAVLAPAAHAAIIIVNTLDDELNSDGDCSLREAVQAANTNVAVDACNAGNNSATADLILVAVSGEIGLTSGLVVSQALNITGSGADLLTLRRASGNFPMIFIDMANAAHDASFSGFAMRDGADVELGSAIRLRQVDRLSISRMSFVNNQASAIAYWSHYFPGATVNRVTVEDCEFVGNSSGPFGGGGIVLTGAAEVFVRRSRFSANIANDPVNPAHGGAIRLARFQTASIADSFFIGNRSVQHIGGAIYASSDLSAALSVLRTSFSGNFAAGGWGGGLYIAADVSARIINTTFTATGNAVHVATGGSAQITHATFYPTGNSLGHISSAGTAQVRRSVVYGRATASSLCSTTGSGTVSSGGFNRFQIGDTSCNPVASDLGVDDPRLLPLEDYGGLVPTLLPMIDSVLIDDASFICSDDQNNPVIDDARGFDRPVAASGGLARCDVGAVEWNPAFDDYIFKHGFNY